jgi:hypothetical protein
VVASVLAAVSGWLVGTIGQTMIEFGALLGCFAVLTIFTILISPWYHQWRTRIDDRDDRDKAGIVYRLP